MRSTETGAPSSCRKFRMKPSSFKIRQISALSRDVGTSTRSCLAKCAFRILARRSETGSILLIVLSLPARLDHAREVALSRQIPETDAAQPELAHEAARTAAPLASVALPELVELELLPGLRHSRVGRHGLSSPQSFLANGTPSPRRRCSACSSFSAVVTKVTFMPFGRSTLFRSISWKIR